MGRNILWEQIQNPLGLNDSNKWFGGKNVFIDTIKNPLGLNGSSEWFNGKNNETPESKPQSRSPNFGSNYKEEELAAGQKAEDFRKGAGFTGQTPTVPTRDVPKASGAKGTQTSPGGGMPVLDAATAAQFLKDKKIGQGAFTSIQLPGTATNLYSGNVPDAIPFGGQETSVTTNTLGAFSNGGVNFAVLDNTGVSTEDAFTNPEIGKAIASTYAQYGGLASGAGAFAQTGQVQKPSASPIKSGRLADALNDTAGMQSYMSKFGSPEQDKRRAAEMAFLNAGTAQEGLRAKEAVLGQFHAGGETYQLGADNKFLQGDNGKPAAMDRDAASAYRLGTSTAEQYKDSYKNIVKGAVEAETIVTPKQAESPFAQTPAAATQDFQMDIPAGTLAPGTDRVGQLIDTTIGMNMTPAISNEQIKNSFLNKREPLMRD